jgi:hypothetical protein
MRLKVGPGVDSPEAETAPQSFRYLVWIEGIGSNFANRQSVVDLGP